MAGVAVFTCHQCGACEFSGFTVHPSDGVFSSLSTDLLLLDPISCETRNVNTTEFASYSKVEHAQASEPHSL